MADDELGRCPCCGAVSGTTLAEGGPALLAVADVLVVRALEVIGHRIVRGDRSTGSTRSRYGLIQNGQIQWHTAHTRWRPEPAQIDNGLAGAWDVVPAMLNAHGCCGVNTGQVTGMLDAYVRDLLITGTPHTLGELRYRFEAFLGIELPPAAPTPPPPARPAPAVRTGARH